MLVGAEREAGIVDLPGTVPPPADPPSPAPAAGAARPAASAAPVAAPRVAPETRPQAPIAASPPAAERPATAVRQPSTPRVVPKVRALDLPADALAPFGGLPAQVAECRLCDLCAGRTYAVFGEGNPAARLVFCGEGPGYEEDRSGRPFVGAAGELLTAMIERGMKLRREDVFILNAVKCRPPENRTPTPAEIAACRPYLLAQLGVIRPAVVVALGNPAVKAILGDVGGISSVRGRVFEGAIPGIDAKVVPTFHPAYLLREPEAKREAWADLQLVMRLLGIAP